MVLYLFHISSLLHSGWKFQPGFLIDTMLCSSPAHLCPNISGSSDGVSLDVPEVLRGDQQGAPFSVFMSTPAVWARDRCGGKGSGGSLALISSSLAS
jgi:hypothetical protein